VDDATHDSAELATTDRVARLGRGLQWATIAWNGLEVFVTIGLGIAAGSLALIAFGLDSLVEVFASAVVVWHLHPGDADREPLRDRRAMRLVAIAFGALATCLLAAGVHTLVIRQQPDSSPFGIAYLSITALVMFGLARLKRRVGTKLQSKPFLGEASMTRLDGGLATGILLALVLNTTLGWWWADPLAAILVAVAAAREARQNWTQAAPVHAGAGPALRTGGSGR
jgi:divalent metal cation (Fe/Co/Zn/Cd) transporter